MIIIRRANGSGHVTKLTGNRRRPYAVRKIIGWTEQGKPRYQYISYHKTKREAERALDKYIDDPYTLSQMTLKDVYKEWIALQTDKAPGTIKAYNTAYRRMKPLYDMKMASIDRIVLQRFYDSLDVTKNGLINEVKLFSQLIKYAVKRGIMPLSSLSLHKIVDIDIKPEGRKTERKVISRDIIDQLWQNTDDETVKQIILYIYTGCRWSELYDLKDENCYTDHIDIIQAKTKAGIRSVPLCDKIKNILPVEPIPSYDVFNKRFKEVLPGYHVHDTRHTFITLMTEAGVDERIIKTIVGHAFKDITGKYTHISMDVLLDAVNKI